MTPEFKCVVGLVEICIVCARKAIIEPAKRMCNSDKICRSYLIVISVLASLFSNTVITSDDL